MGATDKQGRQIQSTKTLFRIVDALQELNGAGITDIADHVEISKGTVHAHLATLEDLGYVVKRDGEYKVGLRFLDHGQHAKTQYEVNDVARPILDQVAENTGELVWLVVEEQGEAVYLSKAMGERGVQTRERIGARGHMHCLASGKAILAHLPEERVQSIIDRYGLPALTEKTITDPDELRSELAEIRDQGVAFNRGEEIDGLRAVAASIVVKDTVHGAICIIGPRNRLRADRFEHELPDTIMGASNEIELKIEYLDR